MKGDAAGAPLLEIEGLDIAVPVGRGSAVAVRGLDLSVRRDETVALVGESGSGKTLTALSIMGLLPGGLQVSAARYDFDGRGLLDGGERLMRTLRGDRIAMVFQEPMTALNPCMTVGAQIAEMLRAHRRVSRREARRRAVALMERVGIAAAARRADDHPHRFSGGMRQRVMIAMAIACEPDLLVADEPTTALDVTVQAQILALLAELRAELGMSLLMITHDFGLVAEVADRVAVLYGGDLAESAPVARIFDAPRHPYTRALLAAVPRVDARAAPVEPISGQVPALVDMPAGCRFVTRCALRESRCETDRPPLEGAPDAPGHLVRCWVTA